MEELKLCHRETTLRFPVNFAGLNFTSLKNKVLYKFPLLDWNSIQLYWHDADDDDILLQHDDDVEALKRSCSNNVLKVIVKDVDSKHQKSVKSEFVKQEKIGSFTDSKNSSGENVKTNVAVDLQTSTRGSPHFVNREKRNPCDLIKENKPTSAGKSAPETNGDKSKKKVFWKPIVDKPAPPTLNNVNVDGFNSNTNTRKFIFRKTSSGNKNAEFAETKISQSSSVVNNNSPRRKSLRKKKTKSFELYNVANRFGSDEDDFREQQPIGRKKRSRKRVKCKLCSAVVIQETGCVRNHLKAAHLNKTSIDWLYQCVTCGKRHMSLFNVQYHVRRYCGKSKCVKNVDYLENKEAVGELAKIRQLAFPLYPNRFQKGRSTVKCCVCRKEVIGNRRKIHAVLHTEKATGNRWLYECLLCDIFKSVYHHSVVNHVKKVHGEDLCRKGEEYNEIDSIQKIIKSAVSFAFPDNS